MFIFMAEFVPDRCASTGRLMTSSGTETVIEDPLLCGVMRRPQASVVRYTPGRLLHRRALGIAASHPQQFMGVDR